MFNLQEESDGESLVARCRMRKHMLKSKVKGKVGRPKKRRFICEYCGKSFLHSGHFEHHIRTQHEQSQFLCLTCNETYITKEELMLHQNEVKHTGEGISEVQNVDEIDGDLDESQVAF